MTQTGTTVRFFTSAALRRREEVPGEAVDWLPRSITVEYDNNQPVTGVWRSRRGARRVCWYAEQVTPALIAAHEERYGDEPFWVIDRAELRDRRVTTCTSATAQVACRRCGRGSSTRR
jgi:hypothetical protein